MFMATLKDVVRDRRKSIKRTQRQIAQEAGISAGYLGMIESGKVGIPSPGVMAGLARALGIPEEELLQSVGYLEGQAEQSSEERDVELAVVEEVLERIIALPSEAEQLSAFQALPPRTRRLIRSLGALVLRADSEES